MYHPRMGLILASASQRRVALLGEAGYAFRALPADADESVVAGEEAEAYVRRVALLKARAVQASRPGDVVLAADTTVVVDGDMLGKPEGDDDARRMLVRLSGRAHVVLTGVAVVSGVREATVVVSSTVRFRPLMPADLDWYVGTGEPADKAGAYAVQGLGGRFVESVEGSYSNVVGLPMDEVTRLLDAAGVAPPVGAPGARRGAGPSGD